MRAVSQLFPAATLAAILVASPASSQSAAPSDPPSTAEPDDEFNREPVTIAIAGVYLPDYEGSNDYRFTAAPAATGSVGGFSFTLVGNRASVDLIPNPPGPTLDIQAGPVAVLNFDRSSTKGIDDQRVKALGKVGTAIELGGYVGLGKTGVITSPYDKLSVSLSYRYDVNDVHKSGIWQPSITYLTPISRKAAIGVFASAEHVARRYGRRYFSVDAAESAASGLPVYSVGRGWKNYTLGAFGTLSLSGDLLHGFKLLAGGTYSRIIKDYGQSPLVSIAGRRSQWLGAAGLAYTF